MTATVRRIKVITSHAGSARFFAETGRQIGYIPHTIPTSYAFSRTQLVYRWRGRVGGRFDGTIDLAYSVEHWLLPDGTASMAHDPGTVGSRGAAPEFTDPLPPAPSARLVHFGADHIFCSRRLTNEDALRAEAAALATKYNYGPITAWRILSAIDFLKGETLQDAYRKVIENRDMEIAS